VRAERGQADRTAAPEALAPTWPKSIIMRLPANAS